MSDYVPIPIPLPSRKELEHQRARIDGLRAFTTGAELAALDAQRAAVVELLRIRKLRDQLSVDMVRPEVRALVAEALAEAIRENAEVAA